MHFYVASAFSEYQRCRAVQAALAAAGHTCTFDWTVFAERYAGDQDAALATRAENAVLDLRGVVEAELLVVLTPLTRGLGCGLWVETGAALVMNLLGERYGALRNLGPLVVACGPERDRTIFTELAAHRCETDEQAVDWALRCAPLELEFRGGRIKPWFNRAGELCGHTLERSHPTPAESEPTMARARTTPAPPSEL